eukprot:1147852-Pelagomonas_calceolata.AAC.1
MRWWISAGACARDPDISRAIIGLFCLIFCNSICTFVNSNASTRAGPVKLLNEALACLLVWGPFLNARSWTWLA